MHLSFADPSNRSFTPSSRDRHWFAHPFWSSWSFLCPLEFLCSNFLYSIRPSCPFQYLDPNHLSYFDLFLVILTLNFPFDFYGFVFWCNVLWRNGSNRQQFSSGTIDCFFGFDSWDRGQISLLILPMARAMQLDSTKVNYSLPLGCPHQAIFSSPEKLGSGIISFWVYS